MTADLLRDAALSWARADRAADDRAAELHGVERAIAGAGVPTPPELLAARARAVEALGRACKLEGSELERFHEVARALLDASCESRAAQS